MPRGRLDEAARRRRKVRLARRRLVDMIYFVKCHEYVKIGYSFDPYTRISSMQTGSPYELEMIALMEGGEREEVILQIAFKHLRFRAEWFRHTEELAKLTRRIQQETDPREARRKAALWYHQTFGEDLLAHDLTPVPVDERIVDAWKQINNEGELAPSPC